MATKNEMFKIHGYEVRAFVQTEVQSSGACGIVLVCRYDDAHMPWVTAWYRLGDQEWSHGHYFHTLAEAWPDFKERCDHAMPKGK